MKRSRTPCGHGSRSSYMLSHELRPVTTAAAAIIANALPDIFAKMPLFISKRNQFVLFVSREGIRPPDPVGSIGGMPPQLKYQIGFLITAEEPD